MKISIEVAATGIVVPVEPGLAHVAAITSTIYRALARVRASEAADRPIERRLVERFHVSSRGQPSWPRFRGGHRP